MANVPFNYAQSIDEHSDELLDKVRPVPSLLQLLEHCDDDIIVDTLGLKLGDVVGSRG